jgi:hypothetical protein
MSCESQLHVGDKNFTFQVTVGEDCLPIDISTSTSKIIVFTKPDGSILEKTALFVTDGTDGKISYSTVDGDIDQAGMWKIQAEVEFGSGSYYHSNIKLFKVMCNLT